MNKLPKEIWWSFFQDKDHYMRLRKAWAGQQHGLCQDPRWQLLYQILRGKDWRRAFTAPTNPGKIQNWSHAGGLPRAIEGLRTRMKFDKEDTTWFDGTVTKPMLERALALLPKVISMEIPLAYDPEVAIAPGAPLYFTEATGSDHEEQLAKAESQG